MEICDLILSFLPRTGEFSYSAYPPAFAALAEAAAPFFASLTGENAAAEAEALIGKLEDRRSSLGRREAKQRAENEKQVLALFLGPAALAAGGGAEVFIGELSRLWNERYPRNRFFPGTFEKLMKGFDANLLGLPLRKSK